MPQQQLRRLVTTDFTFERPTLLIVYLSLAKASVL